MNEKKIELIQQDIEQINVLLKLPDKNKQFDLINRVVETWKGIGFNPSKGLVNWNAFYNDRMLEVNGVQVPDLYDYDWQEDLRQLKNNLEILIEELKSKSTENPKDRTTEKQPQIVINNVINITVTLSQTLQELNKTSLNKEELTQIMTMLIDLDSLKGKKKSAVWDKVKIILLWLGDKAVDVGIAVLPFVMSALA